MSRKVKELRERLHTGIPQAVKALRESAEAEDRDYTPDEVAQIDALASERESIVQALDAHQRAAELEAFGNPAPAASPRIEVGLPNAVKEPWQSFGAFAMAVRDSSTPGKSLDVRLAAASGMNQSVPSEGGFAVPPMFVQGIWDRMQAASDSLLVRTDQYTVEDGTDSLTFTAVNESSRVAGSRWGGVRGYWINEADQITSSKPKLRQVKLEPKQLAVLVYATDKLLRNASALGQFLTRCAADEINFLVGDAIIEGNGAGKPLGILNAPCVVSVAKESGQLATTIVAENIGKMWARMHPRSKQNAVWLINTDTNPQLDQLQIGAGATNQLVYMPPGGLSGSPYGTIKGRPVIECEYCSTLGTVGDIILADLSAYVTGIRSGIESAMSIHIRFDYAETAFRFIFEADGQPWLSSALTPFKGSNTVSPFITLATRS